MKRLALRKLGESGATALAARMPAYPASISQESVPILDRRILLLLPASLAIAGFLGIGIGAGALVCGTLALP